MERQPGTRFASVRGRRLIAPLALALIACCTAAGAQETRGAATRPEEFVYSIPAEGIPLETLAHDAERATGRTFVISDKSPLKGKTIRLFGEARVPKDQALSLFQALFVTQGYALKPLGDSRGRILVIESIDTAVDLKQRAVFVPADEIDLWRNEVGTVVMTFFQLKHVKLQNVRAALSQILTSKTVEFALDVQSANALMIFGFAPTVFAIKQIIAAMDVPLVEADVRFELLTLKNGVADEIEPILANLIESAPARQGAQTSPQSDGPEPRIVTDPRLNAIAVYATVPDLDEIRRIVAFLDHEATIPGRNIHIYRLKHQNAEDVAEVLEQALGSSSSGGGSRGRGGSDGGGFLGGGRSGGEGSGTAGSSAAAGDNRDVLIVPEPHNNALLIRASPTRYDAIRLLIVELDRKRPQVLIQAAVAELTDAQIKSVGTEIAALEGGNGDWRAGAITGFGLSSIDIASAGPVTGSGPGSGTGTGGGMGGPGAHVPGATPNLIRIPSFPGELPNNRGGVFGILSDSLNVPVLVALLQDGRRGNLLSSPILVANDNQQSSISSGTSVATVGFTTSQTGDQSAFDGYQEAKVALTISPHISNDDYVRLEVELLVEAFLATSGTESRGSAPPDKTSRKLVGSVTIRNGATVIIGGLVLDQDVGELNGVPPFAESPIIGPLLSLRTKQKERATIYFFLTPTIISTFDTLDHVSYAKKLEIRKLQGPIRLIDPEFRPILLDDRWTAIDQIEASGNLDVPRYSSIVPLQECDVSPAVPRDAPIGSR